ncbi:hypothetical protein C2S52_002121 [Perilla frutescens var. hirtella]|nr:hypothetical protein C2S52_002121 [Perilla frutescens var. hirtella]
MLTFSEPPFLQLVPCLKMEAVMNNEVVPMELDVQPIITKRRRKESKSTRVTMKHFTMEAASGDRRMARCKKCKKLFTHSKGSIVFLPTHLKRHLLNCLSKEELEKMSQLIHSTATAPPKILSPKIISRL